MAISEQKMKIVIENYFKAECNVNTSIREAFERGFRIGVKKGVSTQPEQQWIPVSERLPKVDESVLVTTEWNDISIAWRIGIDQWFIHEGNTNAMTDDLTAWMPLPQPYKGDADEQTD